MKSSNIRKRIDAAIKQRQAIIIRTMNSHSRDGILAYPYQSGTAAGEEKVLVMTSDHEMKCLAVSDFKEVEYASTTFQPYSPPGGGSGAGAPCIRNVRTSNVGSY